MKKDRNCGATPYPIYPMGNQGMPMVPIMPNQMAPNQMVPNQMIAPNQMPMNYNGNIEQQLNNLSTQVTNLERRVSSLEGLVGSNTNYNTSNFQMM